MTPPLATPGLTEKAKAADEQHKLGILKWLPAIEAPMLGWTGLGVGLALIWLDVPQTRVGTRVVVMANRTQLLPHP